MSWAWTKLKAIFNLHILLLAKVTVVLFHCGVNTLILSNFVLSCGKDITLEVEELRFSAILIMGYQWAEAIFKQQDKNLDDVSHPEITFLGSHSLFPQSFPKPSNNTQSQKIPILASFNVLQTDVHGGNYVVAHLNTDFSPIMKFLNINACSAILLLLQRCLVAATVITCHQLEFSNHPDPFYL